EDAMSAVGRGDDDGERAGDVERNEARRLELDRIHEPLRRQPMLGRIDGCADLRIWSERDEWGLAGAREDVRELGLTDEAQAHRCARHGFAGDALRERLLHLLGGHEPAPEKQLDDASTFRT